MVLEQYLNILQQSCMSILKLLHEEAFPTAASEESTVSIMAKANWLQLNA
jgi:hypothetical protein